MSKVKVGGLSFEGVVREVWVYWTSESFCTFFEVCGRCFLALPYRHLWRTVALGGAAWG